MCSTYACLHVSLTAPCTRSAGVCTRCAGTCTRCAGTCTSASPRPARVLRVLAAATTACSPAEGRRPRTRSYKTFLQDGRQRGGSVRAERGGSAPAPWCSAPCERKPAGRRREAAAHPPGDGRPGGRRRRRRGVHEVRAADAQRRAPRRRAGAAARVARKARELRGDLAPHAVRRQVASCHARQCDHETCTATVAAVSDNGRR